MKKIIYISLLVAVTVCNSCAETDLPDEKTSVINSDESTKTPFDIFLEKEFVDPYNIRFLYKMPDIESDFDYALVPPNYKNAVRMANLVKYLCLDAFKAVAPKNFLKKFFPKQLMLVGSAAYRNNGTRVLGTAEGGLKITLYEITSLDITDINQLNDLYFRTIYHEFAHILHQNIDYSTDFDQITKTTYQGGLWSDHWTNTNPSNVAGYISNYASKEANEDFVELIAHYITNDENSWKAIITSAGSVGGPLISQKMEIVKNYMQTVWSINMDDLRDEILLRGENLNQQDLDNININE